MAKRASASTLVESVAGLAEEIQKAAVAETREDVAQGIEEHFLRETNRRTYGGKSADESIREALAEYPSLREVPQLQDALARFEGAEIPEDFRAGVLFAVKLVADLDYEY
ncbi:hypothetical protein [Amycolatopsis sp. NPDC059657]|uniref:hypothetical protein n=1 Tax=Amycolatopsis sp. NPDC059657 TaxID=3346899 RepID=UPI00366BE07E